MYERIIVPTDGSAGTATVVDHAFDLAEQYDATLDALYVIDLGTAAMEASAGSLSQTYEEEAERVTEQIRSRAAEHGIDANAVMRDGRPHAEIIEHAEETDTDLIVMGTHGRSGLDRVLLGSVTERVVRLSPVPVLTVRLPKGERSVASEERAVEIAREAADRDGHEIGRVIDIYQEIGTWVVSAETRDEIRLNVHIDAGTEQARVAVLDRA